MADCLQATVQFRVCEHFVVGAEKTGKVLDHKPIWVLIKDMVKDPIDYGEVGALCGGWKLHARQSDDAVQSGVGAEVQKLIPPPNLRKNLEEMFEVQKASLIADKTSMIASLARWMLGPVATAGKRKGD
jgi:hypothetical protein